MGEIEKILGKLRFKDNPAAYFNIELNQGGVVHLQTNCWRIELTVQEFKQFVASVSNATDRLRTIKQL